MSSYKIGFIGGGNMARALVRGLVSSGYPPGLLLVADPDEKRRAILEHDLPGVTITTDNTAVAKEADCLVLAVKPQLMRSVCESLAEAVQGSRPLIISVAAGTHSRDIDDWLGADLAVVRVMAQSTGVAARGCVRHVRQ